MRVFALTLLLFTSNCLGQYAGPAVEACRAYSQQEQKKAGASGTVVFERDHDLVIERYTRKLGTQFVSSILTGNGAVVLDGSPSAELSFICLLASDKQPVFFNWLPRHNPSAWQQCTRHEALRAKPRPCLEHVLRVAETDLGTVYALRFQEANEKGGAVLAAYRKSNEEWLKYRDAECARRTDEDQKLACLIDLTRRRALDMR